MKATFASYVFGCRVNEAEKIVLDKQLMTSGFTYNEFNPDFFIINSCTVTAKAEREVRQFIYQTRKKFPQTKIVVTGCAATLWLKTDQKIDGVDQIIPNGNKDNLIQLIERPACRQAGLNYQNLNQKSNNSDLSNLLNISQTYSDKFVDSGRIIVKIQDGCNRYCSYCIVPYLRGKPVTRTIDEIISEINNYGSRATEVVLTAINNEYFGMGKETLPQLIDTVLAKTKIKRLSFGSIHPWSINDKFLEWYKVNANNDRLVHFFHIPIQSGSDKILDLMHRGYKNKDLMLKLNLIKKINPLAFIGTDVIAGFPGETETEFNETYQFLKASPIDRFHIFRYSSRIGTKSAEMEKSWGKIDSQIKIKRAKKISFLGQQKYNNFLKKFSGLTGRTLVLRKNNDYYEGLFFNQLPVQIKTNNKLSPGSIITTKIQEISKSILYVRYI